MGFAESKPSKARIVRQAIQDNPDLKPREISALLQRQGHNITAQVVSKHKHTGSTHSGAKNDRKVVTFLKSSDKFVIFLKGDPVEVDFKRCCTASDLMENVWHLTQREGVKIKHISEFIRVWADVSGILPAYLK